MFLAPQDEPGVVYEFFAPFAHLPGRLEACRIRSPTHGVFDTLIVLGPSTAHPATVYVNSVLGQAFMRERYPECTTIRVPPGALRITESRDGRTVEAHLEAEEGPLAAVRLEFRAPPAAIPKAIPYGGGGEPVWGSRFTCWGVDLVLEAVVSGRLTMQNGDTEDLRGEAGVVTLGSFGRIAPRQAT